MRLTFLGATHTVTGSKFLLEAGGRRVLIDCGLFQGLKNLRLRNWDAPPIDPKSVDTMVLTHAHIDHTGYVPRFVKQGFKGPIYATPATVDLAGILLPDSGHLQEEEARYRNMHHLSRHKPALPLYTVEDAQSALKLFRSAPYRKPQALSRDLSFELIPAGHILGSAFILFHDKPSNQTILFTGDIGRYDQPIIFDPTAVKAADYVVMESTYGNRLHEGTEELSGKEELRKIINETAQRGGTVLIPSFAVGRAQELLYIIRELEEENAIPTLPVYVDSPMAVSASEIFSKHSEEHDTDMSQLERQGINPLHTRKLQFVRTVEESKKINEHSFPSIIISANGMATGGRILHHLIQRVGDARNSIVFVGFQAAGTRGRALSEGARTVRIFSEDYAVRAQIHTLTGFSAHGDYKELLRWLSGFADPPRRVFLVHGEPAAIAAMQNHIETTFPHWNVHAPEYLESVDLGTA
jgi:metallo-beta-lactamase family protein